MARSCHTFAAALLSLSILPAVGCTTLVDAPMAPGTGTAQIFDAPYSEVWEAIPQTAGKLKLKVAGNYEDDGVVLVERGMTAFSYGEKIAIFAEPVGTSTTSVEVVSKKVFEANITAANWEERFLEKLGDVLAAPTSPDSKASSVWYPQRDSPGVSLTLREIDRMSPMEGGIVQFEIKATGFEPEDSPILFWKRGSSYTELPTTLTPDGTVTIAGAEIHAIGGYPPGQPLEHALIADGKRAYARTVPWPIEEQGTGGCRVSVELLAETGDFFLVRFSGLPPSETVTITSQIGKQTIVNEIPARRHGIVALPMYFGGHDRGTVTTTAEATGCSVTVRYSIGRDALAPR